MKKLWILAPLAAAIFAFGCNGSATAEKTGEGGTGNVEANTDAPKETPADGSVVGTYKVDITKEAAELDGKIAEAKKKADGGDEAAKSELAMLEMQKQMMEQMLADMSVEVKDDKTFMMTMGEMGSVSGTYTTDGNKITMTAKEFTGEMKSSAPKEGEEPEVQVFIYDPADQTLAAEDQGPNDPKLKKVS